MKRIASLLFIFIPFFAAAQYPSGPDTVIVADTSQPGLEQVTIFGYKGALRMQGTMLNNKKHGTWREYNEGNGQMMRLQQYRNGVLHGVLLQMGPGGAVILNETYVDGVLQGFRMVYTNAGRIKSQEFYKDGKLNGISRAFYENSRLQEEANWKDGEREGKTTWYLQTGNPSLIYTYKAGKLEGQATSYDEKGVKKQEGKFHNNLEEGEWLVYSDSLLQKKVIYKEGQVVKEIPAKK